MSTQDKGGKPPRDAEVEVKNGITQPITQAPPQVARGDALTAGQKPPTPTGDTSSVSLLRDADGGWDDEARTDPRIALPSPAPPPSTQVQNEASASQTSVPPSTPSLETFQSAAAGLFSRYVRSLPVPPGVADWISERRLPTLTRQDLKAAAIQLGKMVLAFALTWFVTWEGLHAWENRGKNAPVASAVPGSAGTAGVRGSSAVGNPAQGPSALSAPVVSTGKIMGLVKAEALESGVPLQGVAVSVDGGSPLLTDEKGYFEARELTVGTHQLRATLRCYTPAAVTRELQAEGDQWASMVLFPDGSCTPTGEPLDATAAVAPRFLGHMDQVRKQPLTEDMLVGLTLDHLKLMRTEVSARYGQRFDVSEIQAYFDAQPWYKPVDPPVSPALTPVEIANVQFLETLEKQLTDSGKRFVSGALPPERQWALLIGIDQYTNGLRPFAFAEDDVRAVQSLLINRAGFLPEHVLTFTGSGIGGLPATRRNILDALDNTLRTGVKPEDQLIIYAVAHSLSDGAGAHARAWLLPVDARADDRKALEQTAIDLQDLWVRVSALHAARYLLFLDMNRDDPRGAGLSVYNPVTDIQTRNLSRLLIPAEGASVTPEVLLFQPSATGFRSYEDVQARHGAFTQAVLQGLESSAELPEGRVDGGRLAAWLRDSLSQWKPASAVNVGTEFVVQTPATLSTGLRGSVPILWMPSAARQQPPLTAEARIELVSIPDRAAPTLAGKKLKGLTPQRLTLPPGDYAVRMALAGFTSPEVRFRMLPGYAQLLPVSLRTTMKGWPGEEFQAGIQAEWAGDLSHALKSYEAAIESPDASQALYLRTAALYRTEARYADSVDILWQALARFGESTDITSRYALALAEWGILADDTLDHSTSARPRSTGSEPFPLVGRSAAIQAAETIARKAFDQNKGSVFAQMVLATALMADPSAQKEKQDEVLTLLGAGPREVSGNLEAALLMSRIYHQNGQYAEAIQKLEQVLRARPDHTESLQAMAWTRHASNAAPALTRLRYQIAMARRLDSGPPELLAANLLAISSLCLKQAESTRGPDAETLRKLSAYYLSRARSFDPDLKRAAMLLEQAGVLERVQEAPPPGVDLSGRKKGIFQRIREAIKQ